VFSNVSDYPEDGDGMFLRNFRKPVIIVDVDMHVTELEASRRIPSMAAQVVSTPLKSVICRLA
jgi:hypothetical protein